jgi:predicted phage tail component-like protein
MAFSVDANDILQPLGVTCIGDNRDNLLPPTRDFFEEVPGRDGELDFGCEYMGYVLELHCMIEVAPAARRAKLRELAGYLDPKAGVTTLVFADDPTRQWYVRYAGAIPVTQHPQWLDFTVPFRVSKPFIESVSQHSAITTGTIVNAGTVETPLIVLIDGPAASPQVSVAGYSMSYNGAVGTGETLTIDTEKLTCLLETTNAMKDYNGVFPKLQSGNNSLQVSPSGDTTVKWRDRWI